MRWWRATARQPSQIHLSNSPAGKRQRSGKCSAPGRRPSCPPRKQSRRVKRRKALVRNAAPGGHLAVRPVPSTEGTAGPSRGPARLAALHRGDFRGASLHTLGPRFPLRATVRSPGGPAGTLHTGRIARRDDTRGAPRCPADKAGPAGTAPHSTNSCLRLTPSNERGWPAYRTKQEHVKCRPWPGLSAVSR